MMQPDPINTIPPSPSTTITLLGSPCTGKTQLIHSHFFNLHHSAYHRTLEDIYSVHLPTNQPITHPSTPETTTTLLTLHDLGGDPQNQELLSLRHAHTDIYLLCFSLVSRASLNDVYTRWAPFFVNIKGDERRKGVPVLLVGCKKDLRPKVFSLAEDGVGEGVGADEGRIAARKLGFAGYVECSARSGEGMDRLWRIAVEIASAAAAGQYTSTSKGADSGIKSKKDNKARCHIM
jgi:GTPase SAR1 family protein